MTDKPSEPASAVSPRVDDYLRRLRWALEPLPETDRGEIVAETRSHWSDRLASGADFETVARQLGDPESYARAFLENYEISASLGSGSSWRMFATATRFLGRGIAAFFGVLFFFVLYAMAASLTLVALLKPIFPQRVGLWTGDGIFAMGLVVDLPPSAQEHLGYWFIPLCLGLALIVFRLATSLSRRFLQRMRRKTVSPVD